MSALYDRIGRSYVATREEDPRIAAVIHAELGDARTVLNVGAGAGAQGAPVFAVAVNGAAFDGELRRGRRRREFDAAKAVLSDHHWEAGCRAARVAPRRSPALLFQSRPRVLVLTSDSALAAAATR